MSRDAYVFGELTWPMPDPGMVAVWRAMALDASRWDDWEGFVDDLREGTVGAMVDEVSSAPEFQLDVDEVGARLRARVTDDRADTWRRLAIAWRAAADLGASGEFGWRPCEDGSPGFRAVIRDYNSQWEKVESIDVPNDLTAGGEAGSAVPHSIDDSVGEAIMDMDSIADALLAMDSLEMTGETPAETAADATVANEIEVVAHMPGEDAEPVPLAELDDSDLDADADLDEDEPAPAAKKPAAKAKAKAPAAKKPATKAKAKPAAKKPAAKKPAAKAKAKAPAAKKPAAKKPAAKKPAKKKR